MLTLLIAALLQPMTAGEDGPSCEGYAACIEVTYVDENNTPIARWWRFTTSPTLENMDGFRAECDNTTRSDGRVLCRINCDSQRTSRQERLFLNAPKDPPKTHPNHLPTSYIRFNLDLNACTIVDTSQGSARSTTTSSHDPKKYFATTSHLRNSRIYANSKDAALRAVLGMFDPEYFNPEREFLELWRYTIDNQEEQFGRFWREVVEYAPAQNELTQATLSEFAAIARNNDDEAAARVYVSAFDAMYSYTLDQINVDLAHNTLQPAELVQSGSPYAVVNVTWGNAAERLNESLNTLDLGVIAKGDQQQFEQLMELREAISTSSETKFVAEADYDRSLQAYRTLREIRLSGEDL